MSETRVKICGITTPEDASAAVAAGADAIGVVFAGPRQVDRARARGVFSVVPPTTIRVGVFVDADRSYIEEVVAACGLHEVQLHGSESPQECEQSPVPAVKAFRVGADFDPKVMDPYQGRIAGALLDTYVAGESGGTGRTFPWGSVDTLPDDIPVFVAGGLDATNVAHVIELFRPAGVDVSSGVEEWPGHKDRHRMFAFVEAVRAADRAFGREGT
jgi:phosphoribosylanthranilate isomerase